MTFAVYSLWFGAPLVKNKRGLREFIFANWARMFVWIANAKIEVVGRAPTPPFLLVSNHLSYFDIAVLRSVAKGVFVAKGDIETWPLAGKMVGDIGTIYVNRENKRDIPRVGAKIVAALERGEGVIIFAEGTTGNGASVMPLKSSFLEFAAARDLPVHYAGISYETAPHDPPASEAVCWWRDEPTFAVHLFNLFKLKTFRATLIFGAQPVTNQNRKILAEELRRKIIESRKRHIQ